jgi:hypothetical protein
MIPKGLTSLEVLGIAVRSEMELALEYDMLVKHPNYHEDVAELWQGEFGLRKERI